MQSQIIVHETVSYQYAMRYAWQHGKTVNEILEAYAKIVHDQRLAHQAFVFDLIWPWVLYLMDPERWVGSTPEARQAAFERGEWWVPGPDPICDETGQPWDLLNGEPVPPSAHHITKALEAYFRSEWFQSLMSPEDMVQMANALLNLAPGWIREGATYEEIRELLIRPTIYRPLSGYVSRLQRTNSLRAQQARTLDQMRAKGLQTAARREYENLAVNGALDPIPPIRFQDLRETREDIGRLGKMIYDPSLGVGRIQIVPFLRDGIAGVVNDYAITVHRAPEDDSTIILRFHIPNGNLRGLFLRSLGIAEAENPKPDPIGEKLLSAYNRYRAGDHTGAKHLLEMILDDIHALTP